LPYARTASAPNTKIQVSAFLDHMMSPEMAFEMCSFDSADFQMSPFDIEIKLNIPLANLNVLLGNVTATSVN
jgi:hypothetical protein